MQKFYYINFTIMRKFFLFFLSIVFLTNCSVKYKVVGKYEDFNEVFIGTVDSNLMTGTSTINVESNPSKRKCFGNSRVTYIPPISFIIPICAGQKGVATLQCSITGRVNAEFTAKTCKSGFGTGYDDKGRLFAFTFGLNEKDAEIEIDRLMSEVKDKPDLPIYEPEKVRKEKGFSTGTAFFITDNGYLMTNHHVVNNSNKITILINDKEIEAKIISQDKVNDIAIIKVDLKDDFIPTPIPIVKSSSSEVGEEVFTLGYPLIDIQGKELKATFGRINSLSGLSDDIRLMQIDVPIQPGNSGGPLINSRGQVVGIVTATLDQLITLYKKGALPQNVNFAVKSDYSFPILENIAYNNTNSIKEKKFSEWVKEYRESVKLVIAR